MDYKDDYWQDSLCLESRYLHDFQILEVHKDGLTEVCIRCHEKQFFKDDNRSYLASHIRQVLQPNHIRYSHETRIS